MVKALDRFPVMGFFATAIKRHIEIGKSLTRPAEVAKAHGDHQGFFVAFRKQSIRGAALTLRKEIMDKGEKSRQGFLLSISLFKEIEARYIESVTRRNLMEEFEFYRCERCGNVVALLVKGGGTLTCCGAAMTIIMYLSIAKT